ncbi:MAG TPA: fructosamine kinase family protein [Bacteroidales bacterium]|nr:fructosamine kinase family protein [Bacteroidales bacterium]HRZ77890.1 fructosamine kinase family protein [Bacteroidales bacterium]
MIPQEISEAVTLDLQAYTGKSLQLYAPSALGGGSINQACRLRTNAGDFFLKYNLADKYPGMFEAEARGLGLIRATGCIGTPEVIAWGNTGDYTYLLLSYLQSGREHRDYWEDFALRLAQMHLNQGPSFGLDHNNYIGSLPQCNAVHPDWPGFFASERLEPQARMAFDQGLLAHHLITRLERLYSLLASIFPREPPCLVHGDLWSGNFLTGPDGRAYLIDPAVYYGHREMDIAMSKLFGGFHFHFYAAYTKAWPLEPGWQGRVDLCNLYPLLVHLNLFGTSYLQPVERTLKAF